MVFRLTTLSVRFQTSSCPCQHSQLNQMLTPIALYCFDPLDMMLLIAPPGWYERESTENWTKTLEALRGGTRREWHPQL